MGPFASLQDFSRTIKTERETRQKTNKAGSPAKSSSHMTSSHSHAFAERAAVEGEHRLANIIGASRLRWSCGSTSLVGDRKEEAIAAQILTGAICKHELSIISLWDDCALTDTDFFPASFSCVVPVLPVYCRTNFHSSVSNLHKVCGADSAVRQPLSCDWKPDYLAQILWARSFVWRLCCSFWI